MKHSAIFTAALVAASIAGSTVSAQDELTGIKSLNDRIDDITTAANDDLESGNDANRFGFSAANPGWKGSLAASASATSGNTKNRDVSIAGRMRYGSGLWSHSVGFAGEFGSTDGVKPKKNCSAPTKPTVTFLTKSMRLAQVAIPKTNSALWKKTHSSVLALVSMY